MQLVLFGSTNPGKLTEVRSIASGFGLCILSPKDLLSPARPQGTPTPTSPEVPEVEEHADTYEANALLKAAAFASWSGLPALADDAGLEVAALDWGPGVRSARYAGEPSDAERNNQKLRAAMEGRSDRRAQFISHLCAVFPNGERVEARGVLEGSIAVTRAGAGGFGYDSLFIPAGENRTLAEIKAAGEEFATHRVIALRKIFPEIVRILRCD